MFSELPIEEGLEAVSQGVYPHLDAWGWQIGLAFFFVSLAADLLLITNARALVRWSRDHGTNRLSLWTDALILVSLVGGLLLLFSDLANKEQGFRFWLKLQPTSPMSWGSWFLLLALLGSTLRLSQRLTAYRLPSLVGRLVGGLAFRANMFGRGLLAFNVILSVCLGLYTGVLLYGIAARPMWTSLFLPFLFLVSGAAMADALIVMTQERHGGTHRLLILATAGTLAVAFGYALTAPYLFHVMPLSGAVGFGSNWMSPAFWTLGIGVGLIVPLVLLVGSWLRRSLQPMADRFAPWLILAGGLALRQAIVYAGQVPVR